MTWNRKQRQKQLAEEIQRMRNKIKAREEEFDKVQKMLNDYREHLAELEEEQEAIRIIENEILPFFWQMKRLKKAGRIKIKEEVLALTVHRFHDSHEDEEEGKRKFQYTIEAFELPEMAPKTYIASELNLDYVWEKVRKLAENYNITTFPAQTKGWDHFATKI